MSNYSHREDVGAGERLLGAVRRNPEGLLLLAAGAALLMRSSGTAVSTHRIPRQNEFRTAQQDRDNASSENGRNSATAWRRRPKRRGVCLRCDAKGKPNGKCLRVFRV